MLSSDFFLKKEPLGTMQETPQKLENRRSAAAAHLGIETNGLEWMGNELGTHGIGAGVNL